MVRRRSFLAAAGQRRPRRLRARDPGHRSGSGVVTACREPSDGRHLPEQSVPHGEAVSPVAFPDAAAPVCRALSASLTASGNRRVPGGWGGCTGRQSRTQCNLHYGKPIRLSWLTSDRTRVRRRQHASAKSPQVQGGISPCCLASHRRWLQAHATWLVPCAKANSAPWSFFYWLTDLLADYIRSPL